MDDYFGICFVLFCETQKNIACFDTFEIMEIIVLKSDLHIFKKKKKFDLIQIIKKYFITITECIALIDTKKGKQTFKL